MVQKLKLVGKGYLVVSGHRSNFPWNRVFSVQLLLYSSVRRRTQYHLLYSWYELTHFFAVSRPLISSSLVFSKNEVMNFTPPALCTLRVTYFFRENRCYFLFFVRVSKGAIFARDIFNPCFSCIIKLSSFFIYLLFSMYVSLPKKIRRDKKVSYYCYIIRIYFMSF